MLCGGPAGGLVFEGGLGASISTWESSASAAESGGAGAQGTGGNLKKSCSLNSLLAFLLLNISLRETEEGVQQVIAAGPTEGFSHFLFCLTPAVSPAFPLSLGSGHSAAFLMIISVEKHQQFSGLV